MPPQPARVAVVIPTFNEAESIAAVIANEFTEATGDLYLQSLIALGLVFLGWAYRHAGGFGPILSQPSAFDPGQPKSGQFFLFFVPALTGMIGFWATLSLNIPDFSRYAASQRDQVVGELRLARKKSGDHWQRGQCGTGST